MNIPRDLSAAIADLALDRPVRVLNLSGNHERVITLAGLRQAMPQQVKLLAGPGCAASICPSADVFQAIQLAERDAVTLLVDETLLRLPVAGGQPGSRSLAEAQRNGADVRMISSPVEGLLIAEQDPQREVVLFLAGFETLLAPLAGQIIDGLPDNLSLLLCGRHVQPFVARALAAEDPGFDALLLPGNRCALIGSAGWNELVQRHAMPAAISGYTASAVLTAIHAVLQQMVSGEAHIANCYRSIAREHGNPMAQDRMQRVFEVVDGHWRGVGNVAGSAFRLRNAYRLLDASERFTDYRAGLNGDAPELPQGCECASVVMGEKPPAACRRFSVGCSPAVPVGPCMASTDGTCHVHSLVGSA